MSLPWSLRPYQLRSKNILLAKLRRDGRALLSMATGLGKTVVAVAVIVEMLDEISPRRVLFTAPYVPLVLQHAETLSKTSMRVTALTGDKRPGGEPPVEGSDVVVATPQAAWNRVPPGIREAVSMLMRPERVRRAIERGRVGPIPLERGWRPWFGLLVVDEAHTAVGNTDARRLVVLAQAYGVPVLGLTATHVTSPDRTREILSAFGRPVIVRSDAGDIAPYVPQRYVSLIRVPAPPELSRLLGLLDAEIGRLRDEIYARYGVGHDFMKCRRHGECNAVKSLFVLRRNLAGSGIGAVMGYRAWDRLPAEARILRDRLASRAWSHKLPVAVDRVKRHVAAGRKVIVFTEAIEAARTLHAQLVDAGVDAALLVGQSHMSRIEQKRAVEAFRGGTPVLVSTRVGHLGLDIPAADTEVWLDVAKNKTDFIQRFGRVLRQKESALVEILVTSGTGEERRIRRIISDCEKIYGFTVRYVPPGTIPCSCVAVVTSLYVDGDALVIRLRDERGLLVARLTGYRLKKLGMTRSEARGLLGRRVRISGFTEQLHGVRVFRHVAEMAATE